MLGITIGQDGSLALDTNQLQNQLSANPQAVQQFFSTSGSGFSDKLSAVVDQLAGPTNSLLIGRIAAITATIDSNQQRITTLNARLTADQTRLTAEFNNAEVAVAKMQANLNALSAIQSFATIGGQIGTSTSLNPCSNGSSGSSSTGNLGSVGWRRPRSNPAARQLAAVPRLRRVNITSDSSPDQLRLRLKGDRHESRGTRRIS